MESGGPRPACPLSLIVADQAGVDGGTWCASAPYRHSHAGCSALLHAARKKNGGAMNRPPRVTEAAVSVLHAPARRSQKPDQPEAEQRERPGLRNDGGKLVGSTE